MKKTLIISILAALSVFVSAQTDIGVDYFMLGEYDAAKRYFEKQTTTSPAQAYFYLGEIAYIEGNTAEAKAYYQKGLAANPNDFYNQVGEAKLLLKSDRKLAETTFKAIQSKSKKDALVTLAIGRAYFDAGMPVEARVKMDEARKKNKKLPQIYILEGDMIKAENGDKLGEKLGEIAGKYDMAILFDDNYRLGYIKSAQAYILFSPTSAIDKLKEFIGRHPDYLLAHRLLGQASTQVGIYGQAAKSYETYMTGGEYSFEDLERYARVLYFSDLFEDAQKIVGQGIEMNPNAFVMNRFQMYIYAKIQDFENGLIQASKFFNLEKDKSRYLALDYATYATILKDAKMYNEALAAYDKAIEIEPKNEYYLEVVELGKVQGNHALSADYYNQYMQLLGETTPAEYNQLGFYYYNAGTTSAKNVALMQELSEDVNLLKKLTSDAQELEVLKSNSELFTKTYANYYLAKADSVFAILVGLMPDSYSGYRWQALTKHAIDSDTKNGAAKPHYEKIIEVLNEREEATDASNKVLVEANGYLAYHYYLVDNMEKAVFYCNETLKVDPTNKNATAILDGIKQHEQQVRDFKRQQAEAAAAAKK